MPKYQYDVVVIGGGSGGLVAARLTAALGARTCLIDKQRLGGDCLRFGCVPSKTLIHAAKMVHTASEAIDFYSDQGERQFKVNMAKVASRIQEVIGTVEKAEEVYVREVEVRFGQAEFKSSHELWLDGQPVTSQAFILATGSSPRVPQAEGLAEVGFLTNESVFDLLSLPPSLLVVGGGPIGVEMAQAFARLGSAVTIVQGPDRVLPREEVEVSQEVAAALERDGVKIITGARLKAARCQGDLKVVVASRGSETLELADHEIVLALGRQPNTNGLGLSSAGVAFDEKGIKVDEYLQTTADNIFAIGDVIGGYLFTHVAAYQGGLAARNALLPKLVGRKKVDYRVVPWVTFTEPEAARVGLTEAEAARQYGGKIKVQRFPWHDIDRAQTEGETAGFIKLVLDEKSEEIYGAHLVGAHAGEVLAEVALAMQHKLGISDILATIHSYPTLATGMQNAAFEAYLSSSAFASARKTLKPVLTLRG
ncbi:MAG TPA: FAD-dependent oxidoreductase [Chloroflexia bacterium]|nr:FAD-dependent oxidoreductase [Chloroflexia bacterium]